MVLMVLQPFLVLSASTNSAAAKALLPAMASFDCPTFKFAQAYPDHYLPYFVWGGGVQLYLFSNLFCCIVFPFSKQYTIFYCSSIDNFI